jgi:DNA polymerase-3 subunit epsilon
MNLFLDTETNGMKPEQICQLSIITEDNGCISGQNWFFLVETMSEHAFRKHGFSRQKLKRLSGGVSFINNAQEIFDSIKRCDMVIGHNIESDLRMLGLEFKRAGIDYRPRKTLDTMNFFANVVQAKTKNGAFKKPSLEELCRHYRIKSEEVDTLCKSLYGDAYVAHDARYDVALTYEAVLRASMRGDIRGVF